MTMEWFTHAERLAGQAAHPGSRWWQPIADTPRHLFVPAWWQRADGLWHLRTGPEDAGAWLDAVYADRTLVTRVGDSHADHAAPGDHPAGRPTSSSTLPGLLVQMFRHARLGVGHQVLDVGTGTGYGTALLCSLLGDQHVTSVDVDDYLTEVAAERLAAIGYKPRVHTVDATGPLPGEFDRVVATVAVKPIPPSWLAALRPGGRLATTIAGTCLIVTAEKTADGGAIGGVERDWAMFMRTRTGVDYPPGLAGLLATAWTAEGEHTAMTRFPVLDIEEDAWELRSMLEVAVPGIEHGYREDGGTRMAVMVHPDGSWARAVQVEHARPVVHQSGPRRLWDELDRIRDYWLQHGSLPLYGARARITPDGTIHLQRGRWQATIA